MGKRAFTLIELMVVIILIGLFAALILPALAKARQVAHRAQCINNLRQHGIAWYLYIDEHGDCFPKAGDPNAGGAWIRTFGGKLTDYVSYPGDSVGARALNRYLDISDEASPHMELFNCPDDGVHSETDQGGLPDPLGGMTCFNYYGNSYTANGNVLIYRNQGVGPYVPRPLSLITSQHDKVYIECDEPSNMPGHGKVMVLFIDGHVQGPFSPEVDFELYRPDTSKPVIIYPSGTEYPHGPVDPPVDLDQSQGAE